MSDDKYSYFVKIVKLTFIAIVTCNIILLFAFVKIGSFQNIKLVADKNIENSGENTPPASMQNPSFFGLSKGKNRYSIHANKITQIDKSNYQLESINAKYFLDLNEDEYVTLTANDGATESTSKIINLDGNIEITFSAGYRLLTEKLQINTKLLQASSNLLSTITGIKGKIIAQNGFILKQEDHLIEFFGPVKTILHNQNGKKAEVQTIIDSDSLIINYKDKTAEFHGNIKLVRNDLTLYCDKAYVYTEQNEVKSEYFTQHISKIDFFGNVIVQQGGKTAKGEIGEFNAKYNTITLSNNVSLTENGNYAEGNKLTYNLKDRTAKIITFEQNALENTKNSRVKILISDQDEK